MTRSLVAVTEDEFDDWFSALARPLPDRAAAHGTDTLWVVDDGRRVGHVWLTYADDKCVVRAVRLDDPGLAPDVLGLVGARARAAGAAALEAWVTAGDASQQAFVAAGDFTTTSTKMALAFEGPPTGPETLTLRPMTAAEFDSSQATDLEHYIAERARNGESEQLARQTAQQQAAQLLPNGRATDGHHFWVGEVEGRRVGTLWLDLRHEYAFVYNVAVDEPERGRGYGRALMQAGAAAAQRGGCCGIGLNVFGDNTTARRLYDSLGYQVTQTGVRMVL